MINIDALPFLTEQDIINQFDLNKKNIRQKLQILKCDMEQFLKRVGSRKINSIHEALNEEIIACAMDGIL